MQFNIVRKAYILYNSFSALQCSVDVTEDRNRHSFYEVRQIRVTSLQVLQLTAPTNTHMTTYHGGAIAEWSACWTFDPAVGVPVPLAAGGRVAIVGQLLFAPWAWAYSALHPWMVGKWVPVQLGRKGRYVRRCLVCAMYLSASVVAV